MNQISIPRRHIDMFGIFVRGADVGLFHLGADCTLNI